MVPPGGLRRLLKGIYKHLTTGPTPPAGSTSMYFKSDNVLYAKNSSGVEFIIGGTASITSATDPATNAATTTTIVNGYSGTIITTTTTGNSQTLGTPTTAAIIRYFTVLNNDTSTHSIPIVANSVTYTLGVGKGLTFIWDGSKWLPTDLGITSIPVVVIQGGLGVSTLADGGLVIGNGTGAVECDAAGATTEILVGGVLGSGIAFTFDGVFRNWQVVK
jgi:hypothetical protein